jgi:Trypsin-co-occurring domain 1
MAVRAELVRIGDVEFYVEVADGGGPRPVGAERALSFEDVRDTVGAIAEQLAQVWRKVRPDEARVEFGINATAKTGKLTGLLVEGGASAALKITLTWKAETESA